MAKDAGSTGKTRRPARSLEEKIAELQAEAKRRREKNRSKNVAKLAELDDKIVKLESRLGDLHVQRDAVAKELGLETTTDETTSED